MLDFRLDEEQQMLSGAIARYAGERVRKVFRDAEEAGDIPAEVLQAGWEIGVLPTALPEAYGGFGDYSAVTAAVATEEFAWGDLAVALAVMAPNGVAMPLLLGGTEAQQAEFLPRFAEMTPPPFSAALTEPRVLFNPYKLETTAVLQGDEFVLNGRKTIVPFADQAELFLIYAAEEGGVQAFLVPANAGGLTVGARDKLMGLHALPTYALTLEEVRVPAAAKLGGPEGIDFALILAHSRVAMAAAAVGVARAAYEYALDYAKQRVQFGEPIAHRQSIAFMLAEMATDVDEARLMTWEAAWKLDQGQDVVHDATVLKQHVDQLVLTVADRAVQILGGYGYIREYPVELWLRNARGFAALDGLAMI